MEEEPVRLPSEIPSNEGRHAMTSLASGPSRAGTAADPSGDRPGLDAPLLLSRLKLRRSWRLLLAVEVGMLAVVVLLGVMPLYSSLLADAQVRRVLAAAPPQQMNVVSQAFTTEVSAAAGRDIEARVATIERETIGAFTRPVTSYIIANRALSFTSFNGVDARKLAGGFNPDQAQAYAYDFAAAGPHMRIVSGRLPRDVAPDAPQEVLITEEYSRVQHLAAGDTITVQLVTGFIGEPVSLAQIPLRVAGIWAPRDAADPFWAGLSFNAIIASLFDNPPPTYPLLFSTSGFYNAFTGLTPSIGMHVFSLSFTRLDAINSGNLQATSDAIGTLRQRMPSEIIGIGGSLSTSVATSLDPFLGQLRQQVALVALPLDIVVAQLIALALLFIIAMAALLVESQAADLATLSSRGASPTQLALTFNLQGAALAALNIPAGIVLAVLAAFSLIRTTAPDALPPGVALPRLDLLPATVLAVLAGAILGVAALTLATVAAARRSVLAFRREQARGGGPPFWQRYHLDLALAVLAGLGYLELGQFGGLSVRAALGLTTPGGGPDPLLLLTPSLLLVAGALLSVRLFPAGARSLARLAAHARGATAMLSLAQLARGIGRFSRITLLLTLAIALGLFAISYHASLTRNATERADYANGGDLRIQLSHTVQGSQIPPTMGAQLAKAPGVAAVTGLYRTQAIALVDPSTLGGPSVSLLGVDPATFGRVALWHDDFAGQPLPSLMDRMRAHPAGAAAGTAQAPLWTLVDTTFAAEFHLRPGDKFTVNLLSSVKTTLYCVVGDVISYFPTLYPAAGGFVVANLPDLISAVDTITGDVVNGPSEFWLRETPGASLAPSTLLGGLETAVDSVSDRQALATRLATEPLTAGMSALLLFGAAIAALLALLGSLLQTAAAARQRITQFAIMRTLGMRQRELALLLLGQQMLIYVFALAGGTLLGLLLSTATLPFLQFGSAFDDPATLGVPPYALAINPRGTLLFYAALAGTFALGLLAGLWISLRARLGQTLRLSED